MMAAASLFAGRSHFSFPHSFTLIPPPAMQAVWMIFSSFMFATMGVCVKYASEHFNSAELVFYRGILGIAFMAPTPARAASPWHPLPGHARLAQRDRRDVAVGLVLCDRPFAAGYRHDAQLHEQRVDRGLPGRRRADAGQGRPERPEPGARWSWPSWRAFIGVVMLLRPAIDQNQTFAGLVGLMSGLGAAFAYMQVMAISRMGEPETRTVFYFAVGTAVAGALGMLVMGITPWNWQHALWLPPIGILASLGQLAMTKAYSMSENHGGTLMVANLQYSGIVFAAVYSLILFGDNIPLIGWAGMALIIVSAIAATVLRARAAPNAPAEEH
jgi:S-adenosylmethionine uptake transporter